jgi:hypothetical protein
MLLTLWKGRSEATPSGPRKVLPESLLQNSPSEVPTTSTLVDLGSYQIAVTLPSSPSALRRFHVAVGAPASRTKSPAD